MLGDGSTTVTCLQRSAKGSANLPAPAPTSSSVVAGVTSCARRLTSTSSVRCGSALKKEEKASQRSWPARPWLIGSCVIAHDVLRHVASRLLVLT